MQLSMHFDMGAPEFGVSSRELYAAAVDMAEWADETGFDAVVLSEHHGAVSGFLPSPNVTSRVATVRAARAAPAPRPDC